MIPEEVIKRLHESGKYAKTNQVYTVPGSEHLRLFPKSLDFNLAIKMMVDICCSHHN